jgi:hypothetical protein
MTDDQAKTAGVKLVREWAVESGSCPCEACGGTGRIDAPSPEGPYFVKSELCVVCLGSGDDPRLLP